MYDPKKVGSTPMDAIVHVGYDKFEDAWAAELPFTSCTALRSGGSDFTSTQRAASQQAGQAALDEVKYLYALCAETSGFYVTKGPVSPEQQAEIAGMLVICPEFPGADALRASSEAATIAEQQRQQGLRFWGAGLYIVGTDVQPGTFQTNGDIKDCYWARLDAAGEIIDNNFVTAASQVQLTIDPGDYSLSIEGGCGEWVNVG
ncbi:hypothetical protein [Microbacterium shaanxiense]